MFRLRRLTSLRKESESDRLTSETSDRVDTVLLVLFVVSLVVFGVTGFLTALYPATSAELKSIQKSKTFLKVSGCLTIPLVITFTLLSLTRLRTWKGRSYVMDGRRCVGSTLKRWEVRTLQQKANNIPKENQPDTLKEPSKLTTCQITVRMLLSFASVVIVSISCWQGFRSFSLAFRLATQATHGSLPDLTCSDYENLSNQFGWWSFTIFFCLPCASYALHVFSRGTSHSQSMLSIALPFITMRTEVSIIRLIENGIVMKIKEYWLIGNQFVMCPQRVLRWSTYFGRARLFMWYLAVWYLAWNIIGVFTTQFVSRGILSEQTFFGVTPDGWECCLGNSTDTMNNTESPSSMPLKTDANFSYAAYFNCYKLRNVTMSVDSELKTAFSISFSIYAFAITALAIGFKLLAGLCTSKVESHPNRNPIVFCTKVLAGIALVYEIGMFIVLGVWPELLLIGETGEVWYVMATGLFTLLSLPMVVSGLEFGMEEEDIPWQYFSIPESLASSLNPNVTPSYGTEQTSHRTMHEYVELDSDNNDEG